MAAQAAAAAQHGTAVNKHSSPDASYEYGSADKRQKVAEPPQGQLPSPPTYFDVDAYQ